MKKGFTLVELLAVIVILGIIATVATPIVGNVVENSKRNAILASAYGYKETADGVIVKGNILGNSTLNGEYTVSGDNLVGSKTLSLNVSGTKPSKGFVVYENSELVNACLVIDEYEVRYDGVKFYTNGKGDCKDVDITYYYTFDDEGVRSEPVFNENNIPSSWTHYVKATIGDERTVYINDADFRTKKNERKTYNDLLDCEFDNNVCIKDETYDGTYKMLVEYDTIDFVTTEEERDLIVNVLGGECGPLNEGYSVYYQLYQSGTYYDPIRVSHYNTEDECKVHASDTMQLDFSFTSGSKTNWYSCKKESGYVCKLKKSFAIDPGDENAVLGLHSCDTLENYTNNIYKTNNAYPISILNKVTSCSLVTSVDVTFDTYLENLNSRNACNEYLSSLTFETYATGTCESYSGYSGQVNGSTGNVILNFKSEEACNFHFTTVMHASDYTCTRNQGFAIKVHTNLQDYSFDDPDSTCQMLESGLPDIEVNSCNYEYFDTANAESEVTYTGVNVRYFREYDYHTGPTYLTMEDCLDKNLACIKAKSKVRNSTYFIKYDGNKIEYYQDYDSNNTELSKYFKQGIEISDGMNKAMLYTTQDHNIQEYINNSVESDDAIEYYINLALNNSNLAIAIVYDYGDNPYNIMLINGYLYGNGNFGFTRTQD